MHHKYDRLVITISIYINRYNSSRIASFNFHSIGHTYIHTYTYIHTSADQVKNIRSNKYFLYFPKFHYSLLYFIPVSVTHIIQKLFVCVRGDESKLDWRTGMAAPSHLTFDSDRTALGLFIVCWICNISHSKWQRFKQGCHMKFLYWLFGGEVVGQCRATPTSDFRLATTMTVHVHD